MFPFLHHTNILLHIIAGSAALLLGLAALLTSKGGRIHRKSGRLFLRLMIVVIITGLAGVFVFHRNSFLLVITALSGYFGFSGYRVLCNRDNRPRTLDISIAILALASTGYFLYYFRQIGMIWSPVIIFSTISTLIALVVFDLVRYLIPSQTYGRLWFYEHIVKMIGAFTALLSAFTGTVFPKYQPYSQFLPSVFGTLLQIGFVLYYSRKNHSIVTRS
jgi:hypothetical protein